ncbi:N-alpha-acetyltransferase 35, NatC auxiliary subunit-like [Actinia tenebrosa]|uniref:Protein MAK10 homolog n=1 Tax=Actinia tenebrosa TaxID=6105 RepID=A0A6P8II77_ACTTE|nr:N-alpha-acetyltransferase 35, NatC auxiliary subunit-like [Actinia tenebrosa]
MAEAGKEKEMVEKTSDEEKDLSIPENGEHYTSAPSEDETVENLSEKMSTLGSEAQQPKYNWIDITEAFRESSIELKHGELVHDNMFGLFEAMSAIEIMDPKMDAGMLCNKTRKVVQFKPAVEAGMIKIKDFTSDELLGIMDQLMACLVTWLDGHSLVQTVFICLYMHDPFLIEDLCLKAYCIAILKCCEFIRIAVNTAQVFEEEDFQSMTYGFKMGSQVSETRTAGMLKEAEEEISRKLKNARIALKTETNSTDLQVEIKKNEAILARLKFLKAFYCAVVAIDKSECNGVTTAKQLLNTALTLVDPIKKTIQLGLTADLEKGEMLGFEPLVNQRLLPPSFPRYVLVFDREAAIDYLQLIVKRLIHVCSIVECNLLHMIIDFVSEFSKTHPCVLTRSNLQLMVWQNSKLFGRIPGVDVVRDAIKAFNSPPSIAEKSSLLNNPKAKEISDLFINRAVRSMKSVTHTLGHNRARQRDKLGQLLEEFASLQDEADRADAELHTLLTKYEPQRQHFACFGSWVLYHTLNIMVQYLTSGFELELYSPYEYHYIYWYLDFLFGWHMTCLNRAEKLLQAQEAALEQKSGRSGKKNKKKKKASEKAIQEHQGWRHLFQGMRYLCQGYLRALEGFEIDGKLKKPNFEFSSEQIRFERRFLPFQTVDTPQPMYYGHYQEFVDMSKAKDVKARDLFVLSANLFHQAKLIFDMVSISQEEVALVLKVSKTNLVVMKLAAGGHKQESLNVPTFEFSSHRAFPIIRLN